MGWIDLEKMNQVRYTDAGQTVYEDLLTEYNKSDSGNYLYWCLGENYMAEGEEEHFADPTPLPADHFEAEHELMKSQYVIQVAEDDRKDYCSDPYIWHGTSSAKEGMAETLGNLGRQIAIPTGLTQAELLRCHRGQDG